ncbi:SURF1 family protein [Devosia ginsengisoli]|uniref:SURF1 family protein n=1 Tax=Devosia ginsengisoli TaxID=400770 RepID=UPI0026ED15FC|nr:SURF1 family protein [Devosia ginsengisoli]MCR6669823.1 SURF1 family protein [Devosia ginsengisoli]
MSERRSLGPIMTWSFVVLMLALAVVCVWLGTWQLQRLGEKEALIAAVDARLGADPVPVPPADQWATLDLQALNFQPFSLTGAFRYNQTVTVFTSLANARGPASGPGYWVVTPFVLADGGTVFVNRGFIPQDFQEAAVTDGEGDESQVTITGLLRPGEAAGFMTPDPNMSDRIDWVRDPARLAAMVDPALAPIAPFYIDLPAGPAGELPQGGETVVEFPNNHLGYAYTWYGFAIVAVVMLGFWFARQRAGTKG